MEQQEDENGTVDDVVEIDYQDNSSYPSTHSLPIDEGKTYSYFCYNITMIANMALSSSNKMKFSI